MLHPFKRLTCFVSIGRCSLSYNRNSVTDSPKVAGSLPSKGMRANATRRLGSRSMVGWFKGTMKVRVAIGFLGSRLTELRDLLLIQMAWRSNYLSFLALL